MIAIECLSKHECETAGKLHQVLEEVSCPFVSIFVYIFIIFMYIVLSREAERKNVPARKNCLVWYHGDKEPKTNIHLPHD